MLCMRSTTKAKQWTLGQGSSCELQPDTPPVIGHNTGVRSFQHCCSKPYANPRDWALNAVSCLMISTAALPVHCSCDQSLVVCLAAADSCCLARESTALPLLCFTYRACTVSTLVSAHCRIPGLRPLSGFQFVRFALQSTSHTEECKAS